VRSRHGISGKGLVIGMLLASVAIAAIVWLARPDLGIPREEMRVRHVAGFSAIAPMGWTNRPYVGGDDRADTIQFYPEKQVVGKLARFIVSRMPAAPRESDLTKFHDGTFQGQPAKVYEGTRKGQFEYVSFFERQGDWYRIELVLNDPQPNGITGGPWQPFLDSFKIERPSHAATAPASQPTTAPTR
jgi:hypothetical protein